MGIHPVLLSALNRGAQYRAVLNGEHQPERNLRPAMTGSLTGPVLWVAP